MPPQFAALLRQRRVRPRAAGSERRGDHNLKRNAFSPSSAARQYGEAYPTAGTRRASGAASLLCALHAHAGMRHNTPPGRTRVSGGGA
jgi:hypothetical protein